MKKRRWVKLTVIILLAGLAVPAGAIIIKNRIFTPPAQETQAVIEGGSVETSETADLTGRQKERAGRRTDFGVRDR